METKTTYTESAKKAMRKWRENNREKSNAVCRRASAVYYEKNKEKKKKEVLERYYRNKDLKDKKTNEILEA